MKKITSLYLLLFFFIGMYSCTPESTEYPKKYNYTSYSVSSGEMFSKESDSSLEIVQGRDNFIAGIVDTLKLVIDSNSIGKSGFINSYKFVDETLVRVEGVVVPGQVVDSLTTYFISNSFIYSQLEDSTNYVIGFQESEELIVKDFAAIIIKPSVNTTNPNRYFGYSIYDLGDTTMNDYLSNINDNGGFYIGDTVIAMTFSYNYDLE